MKLKDRVAILTAAAGAGIGQATARMLAREGASVVVTDMHEKRSLETAQAIHDEYGLETLGIKCDVTKLDEVKHVVETTLKKFGRIDILLNNAGTNRPMHIVDMTDDAWDLVIDTSLKGTFYCSRAVLPAMMEQKTGTHRKHYLCGRFSGIRGRTCTLCCGKGRCYGIYTVSRHGGRAIPYYGKHHRTKLYL